MPLSVSLPDGYVLVEGPRARGFARPDAVPWASRVLASGSTLHSWAGAQPGRREMAGRGRTWAVSAPAPGPGGSQSWVVRHYHRGGFPARRLRDRYLAVGETRPVAELRASLEASRRGLPAPAVVAGAVYAAGAFYRADLVTEAIPGGLDLAEILFGAGEISVAPGPALAAVGTLLRRLADAGVRHADLNAKNVVLQPLGDGLRTWLVDLDGCRFAAGPDPGAGDAMRRRLERSLRKLGERSGRPLDEGGWAALAAGLTPSGGAR